MDIDVKNCPLTTVEGLQEVCILLEPEDVENAKMIANSVSMPLMGPRARIILALIELGLLKGGGL